MEEFTAKVEFRFASGSVEAARTEIQALVKAASTVGFDLVRAEIAPRPAGEDEGEWTSYGPRAT